MSPSTAIAKTLLVMTLAWGAPVHAPAQAQQSTDAQASDIRTPPLGEALHHAHGGTGGMVAAEEMIAARVGAEILAAGGNAVDAGVAVGFALAVTYPAAGNLGGGGFMLVRMAENGESAGETVAIDYRETAPAAASRDMYVGPDGEIDSEAIYYSHKASGVPGTVAGLLSAHERFGVLPRKTVMAPAILLAERGYPLHYFNAAQLEAYRDVLTRNDAARATYCPDGKAHLDGKTGPTPGETIRRPDLAKTLKAISKNGTAGFYEGWVADAIADDMAAHGGLITRDDLKAYRAIARPALTGTYRGHEIIAFPPPSSGGALLIQMLNMLETLPAPVGKGLAAADAHRLIEVMRRAYADRAELFGDADFVDVPVAGLIDKAYAQARAADIDADRASPSGRVGAGAPYPAEGTDTTHFSGIDTAGNMVANTYTLNLSFGSGIIIPGTGILMNNEMDDFAAAPGVPNAYDLVMGERNAIAPGKRPLSSMTPTLILKDGAPVMALGAQGGSRIITAVLQTIVNVIDRKMSIAEAIAAPRLHHQWLPDETLFEPGLSPDTKALLEAQGHTLAPFDWHASIQAVTAEDGWFYGYSDPRGPGGAACAPKGGC